MMHDEIVGYVSANLTGVPLGAVQQCVGRTACTEDRAIVEAMLLLSPEINYHKGVWSPIHVNRTSRILTEIRRYADASGKKIFRISAALATIPPHEHPTEDELNAILATATSEFELLPNAMLKRIH